MDFVVALLFVAFIFVIVVDSLRRDAVHKDQIADLLTLCVVIEHLLDLRTLDGTRSWDESMEQFDAIAMS